MVTVPVAVIDTNVVVAGLISKNPESPPAHILDGMLTRQFRFLLSVDLLSEYRRVLLREAVIRLHGLSGHEIDVILEALTFNALLQEPVTDVDASPPDPGDAHLWRLLAARDDLVLVTGDKLLLGSPPPFAGALTPVSFLKLLR